MKKVAKLFSVVFVIALMMTMFSACGNSGSGDASSGKFDGKVKLSFTTWIGYAPLFIAKEKGFFEKNGADVDLRVIETAGDINAAAMSGQVQGIATTADTAIMSAGNGLDFVQVLALDTSSGGDGIVSKNEFNTLADLKGKKVALNTTGGASLFYFNYLLDQEGMTMDDFDIQNMSSGDAGSAFVGGKVDAAVTWEPWLSNAKKTSFGKVLASSSDVPGVIIDTLSFNRDFVKDYPTTVKAIVQSWFDALEFIKTDEDEAYKIMAKSQNLSIDEFKATLPSVQYYDQEMNKKYFESGDFKKICDLANNIWTKMKFTKDEVDVDSHIDETFVK